MRFLVVCGQGWKGAGVLYMAWRNGVRRPGQSVVTALIVLIAVFVAVTSGVVIGSLERGVALSRERLGADVMVLPAGASGSASEVLFTAQPVNVYLPHSTVEAVRKVPGVEAATPQFFTQTLDQSCCSVMGVTRVVGIDLASDFVIAPWIVDPSVRSLGEDGIVMGAAAPSIEGDQVSILGSVFHVRSAVEETGTSVDKTIFMDIDAARRIAASSPYLEGVWNGVDPYTSISCVMVKVAQGWDPATVASAITQACPGTVAVVSSELISGLSSQFSAVEVVCMVLLGLLLVVSVLALAGRFSALASARTRELGLMRTLGVGRLQVLGSLVAETAIVTLAGAVAGALLGGLAAYGLSGTVHELFNLPGGAPSLLSCALVGAAGIVLAVLLAAIAMIHPFVKIARSDPQQSLSRGDL